MVPTRVSALAAMLIVGVVGAQPTPPVTVSGLRWKPVEQGVADWSPLSTSSRMQPIDLRVPMDFSRVYQLETEPRLYGSQSRYYARMSGGLTAVFPSSVYSPLGGPMGGPKGENILLPEIPPGTVFSIGGPLRSLLGSAGRGRSLATAVPATTFVDRSARALIEQGPERAARNRTIWTDESFRQERLSTLFRRLGG